MKVLDTIRRTLHAGAEAEAATKAARQAWAFSGGNANGVSVVGDGSASGGVPVYLAPGLINNGVLPNLSGNGYSGSTAGVNYATAVGEISLTPSVYTVVSWIQRNAPDAVVGVRDTVTNEIDLNHPLAQLMRRPNPFYSWSTLCAAISGDFVFGDAYLLPVFDGDGDDALPIELYYTPRGTVKPYRNKDSGKYLDGFLYTAPGATKATKLETWQVIHLRNGIDPLNPLQGRSDGRTLLESCYTEQQITRMAAALARNLGVPGVILSRKPFSVGGDPMTPPTPLSQPLADAVKAQWKAQLSGDGAGNPVVLDGDWDAAFPSVAVDSKFLEVAKNIAQADIAAAFGIPAVVLGWSVGLDAATAKASHKDSREQAYTECLMPMQRSMAEDLTVQLLRYWDADERFVVCFDYRNVGALAENADDAAKRWGGLVKDGVATPNEARKVLGIGDDRPDGDALYAPSQKATDPSAEPVIPDAPVGGVPDDGA